MGELMKSGELFSKSKESLLMREISDYLEVQKGNKCSRARLEKSIDSIGSARSKGKTNVSDKKDTKVALKSKNFSQHSNLSNRKVKKGSKDYFDPLSNKKGSTSIMAQRDLLHGSDSNEKSFSNIPRNQGDKQMAESQYLDGSKKWQNGASLT